MQIAKNLLLVFLGIIIAVALSCAVVGIASAVNDISFGQQIVEWFGSGSSAVGEVVEEIAENVVENAVI